MRYKSVVLSVVSVGAVLCAAVVLCGFKIGTPPSEVRKLVTSIVRSADQVFNGDTPSSSGEIACSTGANSGAWQSPSSCSAAFPTNTPSAVGDYLCSANGSTAAFGQASTCWKTGLTLGHTAGSDGTVIFDAYPDNTGANRLRYAFGDTGTGLQSAFGKGLGIYGYRVVSVDTDEGGTVPSAPSGSGFLVTAHLGNVAMTASSGNVTLTPGSSGSVTLATGTVLTSSLIAPVVTATGSGATTNQQGIETGTKAFAASTSASVTFSPSFTTSAPVCTCTNTSSVSTVKCSATTTTLSLAEAASSSDTIAWICIGRK